MAWILTKNKTNGSGGESQIDTIKVNDVILIPDSDKAVNIEVPTNTNDLVNNSGFITNTVDNLLNYYLKTETYSKNEVNSLIDAVSSVTFEVVQVLPSQDISVSTIYLVPKQDAETNDIYDEYIYVNDVWEKIGSTEMDLTNYVTTSDLNNALAAYTTSQNLNNLLNAKQDVLTPGNNINITNGVISATDTTYTSKPAASGGSDVSLVTTGEKYSWNSKVDSSNLSIKQDKTDNGIKTTAKTVVGAINELLNKFTNYFTKTEVNEKVDPLKRNTRTNLLNPTSQTKTVYGVTFTNNGDGTYTVNGTPSGNWATIDIATTDIKSGCKLVGCPQGGGETSFALFKAGSGSSEQKIDYGNGVRIESDESNARFCIIIYKGYTANNLLFKPMLTTDLSATYNDFVQYSGDGELNENVAEIYENQDNYENIVNLGEPYPTHLGVKNYIDDTGVFHQVLSRQYVKDMTWHYDSTYNAFYSDSLANYAKHNVNNINVYMQGYTPDVNILNNINSDKAILIGSSGNIWVRDTRYNTTTAFTNALGNLKIFYELATPQTWNSKSDISRVSDETYTNLLNPTAQTQTVNGVTFTNNGDGTYTVNGTASNIIWFPIADQFTDLDLSREYKIVGCPQGGNENTYSLYDDKNATPRDTGNGVIYTPTNQPKIFIRIVGGTTVNNLLFKPMVTTKLDATYDDFIPYSGSGALNENVAEIYAESNSAEDALQNEGYKYPIINGVKNYTDSNGVYHKNLGVVDLGTLNWNYDARSVESYPYFYISLSKYNAKGYEIGQLTNAKCDSYTPIARPNTIVGVPDKTMYITSVKTLIIRNTTYTDATAFKNAMSGVLLFYELETPQTWNTKSIIKNGIDGLRESQSRLGCKNLLPNNVQSNTISGVTYTINEDKTITCSGSATQTSYFDIPIPNSLFGKTIIVSGCPSDGRYGKYRTLIMYDNNKELGEDIGNGVVITIPNNATTCIARILVYTGYGSGLTFKPMIRLASDSDDTYQPYAKTNKELTDDLSKVENSLTAITLTKSGYTTITSAAIFGTCAFINFLTSDFNQSTTGWITLFTFSNTNITPTATCYSTAIDNFGKTLMLRITTSREVSVYKYETNTPSDIRGQIIFPI